MASFYGWVVPDEIESAVGLSGGKKLNKNKNSKSLISGILFYCVFAERFLNKACITHDIMNMIIINETIYCTCTVA